MVMSHQGTILRWRDPDLINIVPTHFPSIHAAQFRVEVSGSLILWVSRSMERKFTKRDAYPCRVCRVDCETTPIPSVYCGDCNQWYHGPCQQLSNEYMDILAKHIVQDNVCTLCAQTDGNFNYRFALERMRLASNRTGMLETALSAATLEGCLLRNDPFHVITQSASIANVHGIHVYWPCI